MSERYAQSRAAFAARFPDVIARLETNGPNATAVVLEGGEAVDILVDEQRVYRGNARAFADDQVAAFIKKPLRMFMDRPNAAGLVSPVCIRLLDALTHWVEEACPNGMSTKPVDGKTFLVCFGIGLGHHLEALAEKTDAQWLVIVEPLLEFFDHSFHVVDWAALIDRFDRRGGGICIVTEQDPRRMVTEIVRFIRKGGMPYVDGAWVFTHYPAWAFTEARKRLYEAVEFAFVNRGFYEDELRMMETAIGNFASHSFWLLEGRRRLQRPELAVIAGAGPSLDEGIDFLRENRDRIVLFSAGTALRALLRHGLVPDFHCELENVEAVVDVIAQTAKLRSLKDITLIASATVDPRIAPMFRDAIFFLRDSVVSTVTIGRNFNVVEGTAPTCVNTALATAATMGFKDFVLFGTDCGVRPGADHHASGTVYLDLKEYHKSGEEVTYPLEVPGNFGGTVRTKWVYDACRLMLVDFIRFYGLNVINCSDGAFIPGAVPRVPEALTIANPHVDRDVLRAALEQGMIRFAPGGIFEDIDLGEFAGRVDVMFDDLDRLIDELAEGEPEMARVYEQLMAFVDGAGDAYSSIESIIGGTLSALPRVAMFFAIRVGDPTLRRAIFGLFIAEFRDISREMRQAVKRLFDQVGDVAAAAGTAGLAAAD